MDRKFIGNSAAFSSAALFGVSVVATRVAVGTIPPLGLALLRFGQGGLILLIFLLILKSDRVRPTRWLPFLFQVIMPRSHIRDLLNDRGILISVQWNGSYGTGFFESSNKPVGSRQSAVSSRQSAVGSRQTD